MYYNTNKLLNFVFLKIILRKYEFVKIKITELRKKEQKMIFVYDLIEELCINKGISITTLCRECKIPRSTLTDYKKGRIKSLSADTLCKIADYFGVTVGYLCGTYEEKADEQALKRLLFGKDTIVTDEMWNEIKSYAEFLKIKYENKS